MYRPADEIVPPLVDHVTAVFVVPVTVAANCCVPPVVRDADEGEIATVTAGTVTVTDADANLVVSAALVAVTV